MPTTSWTQEHWYPTDWYELMRAVEQEWGEDDERVRSLKDIHRNLGFKYGESRRLITQAIEMNDEGKINLPSWWILEANRTAPPL